MPEAVELYKLAGESGHHLSFYNLAVCYQQGLGVEKNEQEAFNFFQKGQNNFQQNFLNIFHFEFQELKLVMEKQW